VGERPLVLAGHGASDSKRHDSIEALAHHLVGRQGFAVLAIDGPVHGDRRADRLESTPEAFLAFVGLWSSDPEMPDRMVADWQGALEAARALPEVGTGPVGYWGLSMGTIIGLPLVASDPRFEAAVFGLMGRAGPAIGRVTAAAAAVTCPVHFLFQWDDEIFPRTSSLDLFDDLGSVDKSLHAHPGTHAAVTDEAFAGTLHFLATRLGRRDRRPTPEEEP
jgi:dienelactone hydrolase